MRPLTLTADQPGGERVRVFILSLLVHKSLNIARDIALSAFRKRNEKGDGRCSEQQGYPHQKEGYRAGAFCWSFHCLSKGTLPVIPQGPQRSIPGDPSDQAKSPCPPQAGHLTMGTSAGTRMTRANERIASPTRRLIPRPEGLASGGLRIGRGRVSMRPPESVEASAPFRPTPLAANAPLRADKGASRAINETAPGENEDCSGQEEDAGHWKGAAFEQLQPEARRPRVGP